ncbi:MBL fold metallo-hydrolase [Chryseobacterium sp. CT-SW4]|uniref:MBL fold metallo-hydrolase n=1 Tax=Chryseobacterium sp. SW-1 TaxID=3157343 RepID=UPI003B0271D8
MSLKTSIQLIRNATVVFNYAGKNFLIDPMLAPKGAYPGFEGTPNSHLQNPLTELPVSPESLLDADAVIVTHLHPDHWDEAAIRMIPKAKKIFAQNAEDQKAIESTGFKDVTAMNEITLFDDVKWVKTACQHGSDEAYKNPQVGAMLGKSSGLFFNQEGEKSVYFAGDSIWTDAIEDYLKEFQPDIVVLNTGFAQVNGFGGIIFGKEDVLKVAQISPKSTIIAIHMEALNHCTLSRKELKEYVNEKGISSKVIIPEDGDTINF